MAAATQEAEVPRQKAGNARLVTSAALRRFFPDTISVSLKEPLCTAASTPWSDTENVRIFRELSFIGSVKTKDNAFCLGVLLAALFWRDVTEIGGSQSAKVILNGLPAAADSLYRAFSQRT